MRSYRSAMTADLMTHLQILLHPDPSRVVIRPFIPAESLPIPTGGHAPLAQRIADRVLALSQGDLATELARVTARLTERHHEIERVLMRRFHEVNGTLIDRCQQLPQQRIAQLGPARSATPDQSANAIVMRVELPLMNETGTPPVST
jgi:hypothetical protein